MTVADLIECLSELPKTAIVVVRVTTNEGFDGTLQPLEDCRELAIDECVYEHGEVSIRLDEPEFDKEEDGDE